LLLQLVPELSTFCLRGKCVQICVTVKALHAT
jgi:hypothetical protein